MTDVTPKQIATLTTKVHGWLQEFRKSEIFAQNVAANPGEADIIDQVMVTFATEMLTEYDRQPSRWTVKTVRELVTSRAASWAQQFATEEFPVDADVVRDEIGLVLNFLAVAKLVRGVEPIAKMLGELDADTLMGAPESVRVTDDDDSVIEATISEHIGQTFQRVQKFFKLPDVENVQDATFAQAHFADIVLLAEGTSFIDLAVLASLTLSDGSQDDFVTDWLRENALPEINVAHLKQVMAPIFAAHPEMSDDDVILGQMYGDMEPVSPATRLAIAMRHEHLDLGTATIEDKIKFQQAHRRVLAELPDVMNYLPKEQLSRGERVRRGKKNNVLSFAAAKKLAKKNKRK